MKMNELREMLRCRMPWLTWVFAAMVCLVLSYHAHTNISGYPTDGDGRHNLMMAYNLYANGSLSLDAHAPFRPTAMREPLPPMVTALFMALVPDLGRQLALVGISSSDGIVHGEAARLVKQINVIWIFAGLIGCWVLSCMVGRSHRAALLVVLAAYLFFFSVRTSSDPLNIQAFNDSLYTEVPASVLMLWTAVSMVWLVRSSRLLPAALSGLLLGMLTLTKAAFVFVFAGLMPFLIAYYVLVRHDLKAAARFLAITMFCAGFAIPVGSWVVRNKVQLDSFGITQRSGLVLLIRAFKNEMTPDEKIGAYWYWGPRLYQRLVRGTPYGADSVDFVVGGRYERVNRYRLGGDKEAAQAGKTEAAVSFYWHARAWKYFLIQQLEAQGQADQQQAADLLLQRKAMQMIVDSPGRHLALTPLFLWRGIWCFREDALPFDPGGYRSYIVNLINAVAYCSIFVVFVVGLARRRYDLVAMTVVSVGMIALYGLVSHGVPRYSAPAIPIMLVSLLVVIRGAIGPIRAAIGRRLTIRRTCA